MRKYISLVLTLISGIFGGPINREIIKGSPGASLEGQSGIEFYNGNIRNVLSPAVSFGGNLGFYWGVLGIKPGMDFSFGKSRGPDTISGKYIGDNRNTIRRSFHLIVSRIYLSDHLYFEPYAGIGIRDYFINLVTGNSEGFQSGAIAEYKLGVELGVPWNKYANGFYAISMKIGADYFGDTKSQNKLDGDDYYVQLSYSLKGWMVEK